MRVDAFHPAHLRASSRGVYVAEPGAATADVSRKHISGSPRFTVRPNYVGLPGRAGRGPDERRRKPAGSGRANAPRPGPEATVRGVKSRCGAPGGARFPMEAPTLPKRGIHEDAPPGAPLPHVWEQPRKYGRTRRPPNNAGGGALPIAPCTAWSLSLSDAPARAAFAPQANETSGRAAT